MSYKERKIIDIDLDDTLCDFSGARAYALANNPDIKYPQSQYGFYANLKPIDGARFYVGLLSRHFDVHIVTRPSIYNPLCYTEKAVWVERYFGREMLENFTITCHKDRLDGDYLIDDTEWPAYPGQQILFGKGKFTTWHDVWHYIAEKERITH